MTDAAVAELTPVVGVAAACKAVGRSRATHYRHHPVRSVAPHGATGGVPGDGPPPATPRDPSPPDQTVARRRQAQPRALSDDERAQLLTVLDSPEHVDAAPAAVYHDLLDQGIYLASVSTMYRVLREAGQVRERRRQATHPAAKKPELLANGPNELWSWDITKLAGPQKWTWYHLYVIIDVFSRYVPGWMIAPVERAVLAERLLADTITKQGIVDRDRLTLHADRGTAMTSKPVAYLLADLGVTKTHSRPHVSNDNPYSESQFKTLKYRPDFPERFGSLEDARAFCTEFFRWYNDEHFHSGIAWHHPADLHYGRAHLVREQRARVLDAAHAAHPERFVRKAPTPPELPTVAWINKPPEETPPDNSTNP